MHRKRASRRRDEAHLVAAIITIVHGRLELERTAETDGEGIAAKAHIRTGSIARLDDEARRTVHVAPFERVAKGDGMCGRGWSVRGDGLSQ